MDSPVDPQGDASAPSGSNADAEDSAAHIAELVRRTGERQARPGPSSVVRPAVTIAQQPPVPAQPPAQPLAPPPAQPLAPPARSAMRRPSRRILVAAGTAAAVLIGAGLAWSLPFGSDAGPTSPSLPSSAPAGYTVKVTDVITDCASHAHGRTKTSFETQDCVKATRSLATGRVSGRPALFVVSRIQMTSAEAAASVKQVLDKSGTGNLNDLLLDGKTFPGAPDKMPASGYASVQMSKEVSVAEAGFVDGGPSANTNAALRAAAAQVAALASAQN